MKREFYIGGLYVPVAIHLVLMRACIAIALLWAATISAQPATLVGLVADSVHGGPLTGALVVVEGTGAQATVDDHGRFRIDSIAPGSYRVGVFHPLLDSLGVALTSGDLAFTRGMTTSVILATPSVLSVIALYCSAADRERGAGAIIGRVTIADSDVPVTGGSVRYRWFSAPHASHVIDTPVTPDGAYHICGVPLGSRGSIRAEWSGQATGDMPAEVATRPLAIASLRLPRLRGDTAGSAVVSGRVLDVHGVPVAGVDVILDSAERTLTSDSGAYTLRGVAAGSRVLQIRKLGFRATDVPVELSAAKPLSVTVTLYPAPPVLQTVDVTATRQAALERVGFMARERSTPGQFLTSGDIAKRGPVAFSDVARTLPQLKVIYRNGQPVVTQRRGDSIRGKGCVLYELDGIAFSDEPPGMIDNQVTPESIIALEVYSPGAAPQQILQDAIPGDFGMEHPKDSQVSFDAPGTEQGLGNVTATACTVVVIWTKASSGGS